MSLPETLKRKLLYFIILPSGLFLAAGLLVIAAIRAGMDKDHVGNQNLTAIVESIPQPKNKYPIVLHHGMLPFVTMHKLARDLRAKGYLAFSTQISAANTVEFRSNELMVQLEAIRMATKSEKLNIVAHSMGGIDARYLISSRNYAPRVASLTTLSTPHHGASVARMLLELPGSHFYTGVANFVVGAALDGSSWFTVDMRACLTEMTPSYFRDTFNPRNPDAPNVIYQSYAGMSGTDSIPPDPIHFWSQGFITASEGKNDGIVAVNSAKWANYLGTIPAPHSVIVGRFSITPIWDYDPYAFFNELAEGLVKKGF